MATSETKLWLNVLVDSNENKVLFAEADSEITDVIFGFLTVPLGTINRQLKCHCSRDKKALGCLNNLNDSVATLGSSHFWSEERKGMLLHPWSAYEIELQKLKLKIDDSQPRYAKNGSGTYREVTAYFWGNYSCGSIMSEVKNPGRSSSVGLFTSPTKSFIITDDLRVMPSSVKSNFKALKNLVHGVDVTEVQKISLGFKEILHLLRFSLLSRTTLTSFMNYKLKSCDTFVEPDNGELPSDRQTIGKPQDYLKMVIKALLHKSTKKLLFFVAGVDFIEFLFTLLTIPLGKVVSLLNGNSNLGSIDNLHKSVNMYNCEPYENLQKLTNPQLPEHYLSKKHIQFFSLSERPNLTGLVLQNPEGEKGYVKGPETFMVSDNLVVTPLSPISIISYLSTLNLHLCDVEELDLVIGTNEALDILRASLTMDASALSSSLHLFDKVPKKEK